MFIKLVGSVLEEFVGGIDGAILFVDFEVFLSLGKLSKNKINHYKKNMVSLVISIFILPNFLTFYCFIFCT